MYGYYYKAGRCWNVENLWKATKDNKTVPISVDGFIGQDNYWNIGTFKCLAEEMKQVLRADYSYPIIINEKHEIVDGAHRVVHAYIDGVKTLNAVIIRDDQFPTPDYDEYEACKKRNV